MAKRAETLKDTLELEIIAGIIPPGERLDEQSLAARFGVSRTPVREALMQLGSMGLVSLHPNRGAFVQQFSMGDVIERFEVMAALEGLCAELAARRITAQLQAELLQAHRACAAEAENGDSDAYYYANERFHHLLYRACMNLFLEKQARDLHARLQPYRRLQLRAQSRVANSLSEHQEIVDAILAGDAAEARKHAKRHILIQGERLADFIAMFETRATAI